MRTKMKVAISVVVMDAIVEHDMYSIGAGQVLNGQCTLNRDATDKTKM